jgi:hypothetical protein
MAWLAIDRALRVLDTLDPGFQPGEAR